MVICEDKFILSLSSSTQQNTLLLPIHLFLKNSFRIPLICIEGRHK
jgi:hypothetical protein